MDVFGFRDRLIAHYAAYIDSFINIREPRIDILVRDNPEADGDGAWYRVLSVDGVEARYTLTEERVEARYPLSEGLVGWALRHRMALHIPDLQDETRLPPDVGGVALHQGRGALLVLPLTGDDKLLGALAIGAPRLGAYTDTDRGVVNLIVAQVAAVRIALLMAELDGAEAIIAGMARRGSQGSLHRPPL